MKVVLVTGSKGFLGQNLIVALRRHGEFEVLEFCREHSPEQLSEYVQRAEMVFHLAGVNRPKHEEEFTSGNVDLTRRLCEYQAHTGRTTPVVFASSIQAEMDNAYGRSKMAAENALQEYSRKTAAPVFIYRFPNIFGKWSRPNYNTVVATFCHRISRGIPVEMSNRSTQLNLVYIDDVVGAFLSVAVRPKHEPGITYPKIHPIHSITLGELYDLIASFQAGRDQSLIPDFGQPLTKDLYSTYLSFCATDNFHRPVDLKTDDRGWLFELVKSPRAGQIFVSQTHPGVTRGNHYHDTKVEKFCVIQGEGIIRFRHVLNNEIIEYRVNGGKVRIVDIPPGYTHSIENIGRSEMITLFWSNEIFDPQRPDTHFVKVQADKNTRPSI